jgi:hypothetical protein
VKPAAAATNLKGASMNRLAIAAALATAAFSSSNAFAAETISVVSGTRGVTIASNGPVAQTFVATDSLLTNFGFQFGSSINNAFTGSVTFSLLAGSGTTGAVLASQTVSLANLTFRGGNTWYDVFTGTANLVTGQTYTALLSNASSNVSLTYGPNSGQTVDAYTRGFLIKNNTLDQACLNNGYCDANFRFTTAAAAAAVPETATWGMMIAGFGLTGASLRVRRRSVKIAAA